MTPMIDIVFLLIVFFMAVSQMNLHRSPPILLPKLNLIQPTSPASDVIINMEADGKIVVGGNAVTGEELPGLLTDWQKQTGIELSAMKIQFRCAKNCPAKHVNRLFRRLANLGVHLIHPAAHDGAGGEPFRSH